ncbi:DUF952 domain-containing protein [Paracoccus salsus]|uniref:DUF952 domain-containing protein n=1 Tax=Paracoccus salsus TaxID=2911061 RepID=UPI001F33108F|nr:DUF952 domain-containing protein [Paracoccus salsus]MCF3974802.1 DUF952 domain-containing protein [Paracoccus salsus]
MLIYKILLADEWATMQGAGKTEGAPVDVADGFVHLSTAEQLPETLSRHFAGVDGLVLLACDAAAMGDDLQWEPSRGGDLFPHLYRPLLIADIRWTRLIQMGSEGHVTGRLE